MATIEERLAAAKKGQKAGAQVHAGSVQDRINRAKGSGATQSGSPQALSALQKYAEQQAKPVAITPMSQGMGVASFGKQLMGQTPSAVLGGKVDTGVMSAGEIKAARPALDQQYESKKTAAEQRMKELNEIEADLKAFEMAVQNVPAYQRPVKNIGGFTSSEEARQEYNRVMAEYAAILKEAGQTDKNFGRNVRYALERGASGFSAAIEGLADAGSAALADERVGKVLGSAAPGIKMAQQMNKLFDQLGILPENASLDELADKMLSASPSQERMQDIESRYAPGKVGQTAGEVSQAVGGMIPAIAANIVLPGSGLAVTGVQAGGQSAQQAYQEGATMEQATNFGIAAGALEGLIEALSGGVAGLGEGFLDTIAGKSIGKMVTKFGASKTGKVLAALANNSFVKVLADSMGEGIEEGVSAVLTPYLARLTYNKEAKTATAEEVLHDIFIGALTGGVFQGVGAIGSAFANRGNATASAIEGQKKTAPEVETAQAEITQPTEPVESGTQMAQESAEGAREGMDVPVKESAQGEGQESLKGVWADGQKNHALFGSSKYTKEEADAIRHEGRTFVNIVAGIDSTVSEFFKKWAGGRKSHLGEKLEKLYLGKMTDAVKSEVSDILGYDVDERDFIVTNDDVKHIVDEHGDSQKETGQKKNIPLDDWVLDALPEVVTNPDTVKGGHEGTGKNSGKTGVLFSKTFPNGRIVTIQFDNRGRGTMEVTTIYAKESTPSMVTVSSDTDTRTPEVMEPVLSSNQRLAQKKSGVNIVPEISAEDVQRSKQAKHYGNKSGLVRDDNLDRMHLSYRVSSTIDAIAKIAGVQVRVVKKAAGGKANGTYSNGVIEIAMDCENPVMTVFTHELVHRIRETSPESYAAMAKFVQKNIGNRSMKALANRYSKAYETKDVGEWSEEMVADAFATVLNNRKVMEQFAQDNRTAFEKVRDVIRDMINAVKRVLNGQNARMTGEQRAAFSRLAMQLQEMENVMADAIKNLPTQEEMSVGKSGNRESAADIVKKSLKWDSKFMDAAEFANKGRISASVMQSARESRQAVADIFNDPDLADSLGLPPDIIGKTYIPNGSYSGTEENTTECIRTLAADDLMDAVAEYLGRPLTVEDTIAISQEYWKYTDKPECLYCYVAMDRKAHREFLGSYLQQRDDVVKNIESGMSKEDAYQKFLDGRKDTAPMKKRFDMWVNNIGKETISPADLASRASMEKAAAKSASFKAQVNDALKYAQSASWAKKRITYTAYDNHILKWKQNRIDNLNSNYGLRMYSFSDFSPAFILENMQMITDASVRGLKVLAYTKELDFVRIFAKTGMNINISVFGYNDGDGVAMDAMQGADWAEAQALRKKHSNVGCTFVATNDSQVEWALDQDWIDVIIPFHMVRTGTKVASAFGWKNYTAMSADTKAEGWTKENAKHILPPMHQNDKATYLNACKDNNLTPRFEDWVDHPNYMKLVNETRQSEGDTNPVQPVFDLDAAKSSIETMRKQGGYYTPVGGSQENMRDIAEEIGKKIESKKSMKSDSSSWKEAAEAAKQDVKDAKLAGMMNQGRKDAAQLRKAKETTAEVRLKRDEAIKELKQKQREREASMRESRNATAIRAKIERHVKELSSKLRNPTDKKHIPEAMREPLAKVLASINMESRDGAPTKRTKAFAELKEIYNTIAGDVVVDPDLFSTDGAIGLLDEVIAMADKRISEMSVDELETVWKTIRAIEVSIRNANKTFAAERYKTVQDAAKALWDDNIKKKDKGYLNGLRSLIEVDMLTPEAFFHRLGDAGDSLFKAMRAAQDKHIRLMKQVSDFSHENLEEINVKKLEKEIHTVTLGGQKVEMSAAQLMELYALMRRKQALDHLLVGGIKLSAIQKKGKKVNRSDVINGITYDELVEATSALDDDLLKVAELMQAYASTTLSDFGNEASMEVYGYRKFNEENYWPIRSSKSGLNEDIQQATQVTSVANRGFTKNAKPHANNAVQIGSIFDTFASHSSEMATYSAWLGVSEDLNRIRNFKYKAENADGSMRQIGTVKGLLDRVFGSGEGDKGKGQSYIEKLLADIATGVKGGNDPTAPLTSGFIGNYKAASIGANLRVVIQQPTAILRSLELLDAKYLASGVASKWMKGFEKAKEYAPIAQWKDWGYFDIHTGRQMKDVLFESDSALEKTKEIAMKPAGWMDSITWGALWNALETETKDKTGLNPGTEEFYKKVAERFGEIIDRTQVVDGILQRSQIMRSPNSLAKMATSFMGEPTKQYNMLLSAIYDAKSTPEGKKRVLRTSISLASSALLNVVAQSIVDGLRDDDREEKYWERVLKAAVGAGDDDGGFWNSNLFGAINPAAYIPYIKDVWSIVDGYDVSRMDMDGIERTVSSAKALMKALQGKGTKATGNAVVSFVAEVARLFGIPLANVKREVTSVAITAAVASENYLLEYKTRKLLYRVSENTKMFYDILFDAMEAKDDEYYTIYADMLKSGLTEEKIKAAMEDRMKKKQGVNSVKDLEKRWEAPRPK